METDNGTSQNDSESPLDNEAKVIKSLLSHM